MHTTCVPICNANAIPCGMFAAPLHQEAMPQIVVRIADEDMAWLDSQTRPYHTKSAVIRDLIHTAKQRVDTVATLPAYRVGAGDQGLRVPAVEAVERSTPQLPENEEQAVLAVGDSAETKKNQKKEGIKIPKSQKPRAKKTKGSPEFEAFWGIYQSAPMKANKQAKPQAWEVWQQLVPDEISADDLISAISIAIQDMDRRTIAGEFCSSLPDCFRWLRDECYSVFLESHSPRQASGITVLS